ENSAKNLSDQVARLGEVTHEVLDGVTSVVSRFQAQTEVLTEASSNLAEVNKQIETSVEERRPVIEGLAAGLRARSEELDGMMRSFTRIIGETLKTAEERATAVSRMLTENTATATKGVIDNFETMNRTAGTESRKASEAVREANKAMILEMGQAIAEATKRFGEATREMRQATHDLQRDLNATRDEIRRGVLELPEEAREGAEAMRRVVGDQLKALSELSEIIGRHGKWFDVSTPSLGEVRAAGGGETLITHQPMLRDTNRFEPPRGIPSGSAGNTATVARVASPPRSAPRPVQTPLRSSDSTGEGGWV